MNKYAIYTYKLTERPRRNEIVSTEEEAVIEKMEPEKRFELLFGKERGAELSIQKLRKNLGIQVFMTMQKKLKQKRNLC